MRVGVIRLHRCTAAHCTNVAAAYQRSVTNLECATPHGHKRGIIPNCSAGNMFPRDGAWWPAGSAPPVSSPSSSAATFTRRRRFVGGGVPPSAASAGSPPASPSADVSGRTARRFCTLGFAAAAGCSGSAAGRTWRRDSSNHTWRRAGSRSGSRFCSARGRTVKGNQIRSEPLQRNICCSRQWMLVHAIHHTHYRISQHGSGCGHVVLK